MSDAQLRIRVTGHEIIVTDNGLEFRTPGDEEAFKAHLGKRKPKSLTEWVERVCAWLNDYEPYALVIIDGVLPPGHPHGVPASRPNGRFV